MFAVSDIEIDLIPYSCFCSWNNYNVWYVPRHCRSWKRTFCVLGTSLQRTHRPWPSPSMNNFVLQFSKKKWSCHERLSFSLCARIQCLLGWQIRGCKYNITQELSRLDRALHCGWTNEAHKYFQTSHRQKKTTDKAGRNHGLYSGWNRLSASGFKVDEGIWKSRQMWNLGRYFVNTHLNSSPIIKVCRTSKIPTMQ